MVTGPDNALKDQLNNIFMLCAKIKPAVTSTEDQNTGPLAWAACALTAGLWPLEINNTFIILGLIPSDYWLFILFHLIRSIFPVKARCRTKHTSYKVDQSSNKAIHPVMAFPWFFLPNVCVIVNFLKQGRRWCAHKNMRIDMTSPNITWHHDISVMSMTWHDIHKITWHEKTHDKLWWGQ